MTVDSGSAVNGLTKENALGWKQSPAPGLQSYTSASQDAVNVLGRRTPECSFQGGYAGKVDFKVLDKLKKALFATSRMVQGGFRIVHDSEEDGGSYALHKATRKKIRIYLRNGVYVMPVWMRRTPLDPKDRASSQETQETSPFKGQVSKP